MIHRIKSELIYNVTKNLRKDEHSLEMLDEIRQLIRNYEVQTK